MADEAANRKSKFQEVSEGEGLVKGIGRGLSSLFSAPAATVALAQNEGTRERLAQKSEAVAGKPVDQRWIQLDSEKERFAARLDDPIPAPWKQKPRTVSYMDVAGDDAVMREMAVSKALSKAVYGTKEEENRSGIETGRRVRWGSAGEETFMPMEGTRSATWDGTSLGTGLGAQAFESAGLDGKGRTVVCAFAGTSNAEDAGVDLKNFAGFSTLQYEAAQAWLNDRLREIGSSPKVTKEVMIAGHSLGGGLALSSALSQENRELIEKLEAMGTKVHVSTWNTAGLPPSREEEVGALPYSVSSKIKNFINEGEPVSNFGIVPGHQVIVPAEKRTRGFLFVDPEQVGAAAKIEHANSGGIGSALSLENLKAHKMDSATDNLASAEIGKFFNDQFDAATGLAGWREKRAAGLGLSGSLDGESVPIPPKAPGI